MAERELSQLIRKRGAIKAKLTNFIKFLEPIQEAYQNKQETSEKTIFEIQLRVDNMTNLLQEFEETQISIEYLWDEEALEEQYIERDHFSTSYSANLATAKLILHKLGKGANGLEKDDDSLNSEPCRSRDSISMMQNIKLPTINLPKFTGSYNSWLEYKDTFESLIHLNNSINDVQKYHYLRASLQGDASKVIQSLDFSANNYSIAWKLLCERYNNSRLLVHNHVKALFELETFHKESSSDLRNLIDNIYKHLRALETLRQPTQHWDTLIIFIITSKLDKLTAREWEKHKVSNEFPTLDDMNQFLKSKADWLETLEINHFSKAPREVKDRRINARQMSFVSSNQKCNFCKQSHLIYTCEECLRLDVPTRIKRVSELKLCQNCLCTGHIAKYCKYGSCRTCHKKHSTLIHLDVQNQTSTLDAHSSTTQVSLSSYNNSYLQHVLLATAVVSIYDAQGNTINIRILLDSASQSNFISAKLCKRLNLEQRPINIAIVGINTITSNLNSKCDVTIKSLCNTFKINIPCLVLAKITDNLPNCSFNIHSWNIPQRIQLADPNFNESGEIDLLLGASHFWNVLRKEQIRLHKTLPILQNTMFGWIVSASINQPMAKVQCHFSKNTQLDSDLRLFWELEEISHHNHYSDDDQQCENDFIKNVSRDSQGRFIVRIPLKHSPSNLGKSKDKAIKRFLQLEQRLNSNSQLKEQYVEFMLDYLKLGHMSISNQSCESQFDYFLPHHGVLRSDSLTTKLRVVFDGSAPSDSGWCVNDLQFTGPAIQNDFFAILLRFREHKYVVSADIAKMYREILVHPEDRHLQKIVWRSNPNETISSFTLNTVTCLRFIGNLRKPKTERKCGTLTVIELAISMKQLVKLAQANAFAEEIQLLNSNKGLQQKHKLLSLAPFIDDDGLLRVGGRLKHSQLQFGAKHPLLLSGKHILSKLIFEYEHKALFHAGPQLLLATVRQNYWPTAGMTAAKRVTRNCVRCFRFQPKTIIPIMANLPENRVKVMNPFFVTGLDYAGPFSLKDKKGRGCKIIKGYICLFICFASKAVHLEVVTDLTTESFIAVLRRFASRRGKPAHIYSDNATNFVGAKRQLSILYQFLSKANDEILNCCANENILWHFIPPNSPHFGGLWESAVKSAKHHLLRVLKDTKLTYEEFNTVIVQIESILNSRPLYPLSSDPNDLQPITPAHFLIGKPLTTIPDPSLMEIPLNKLTRYQLLQHINQGFWARWSKEYLSHVQQRSKWTSNSTSTIEEGRLALIKHDNLAPCNWVLGRIVKVHPGDDGVVRVVTIKTSTGVLKRAVSKICPLPLQEQKDN